MTKTTRRRSSGASLVGRDSVYFSAAALAAEALFRSEGFRQRDFKFLVELFMNWLDYALGEVRSNLTNMQVARYLKELVEVGAAKRVGRGKQPRYTLTRGGIVDILSSLLQEPLYKQPGRFLFVQFFLRHYRTVIIELVSEPGAPFPRGFELELKPLLDVERFVEAQRKMAERELAQLSRRMEDSSKMAKLALSLYGRNLSQEKVVAEVEKLYPYELNAQKPLSDFFQSMPEAQGKWELTEGSLRRVEELWGPLKKLWLQHLTLFSAAAASKR